MKTCFLVLACVAYAAAGALVALEYSKEDIAKYNEFKKECIEEVKVDEAIIDGIDKGTFPGDYKDTKCFYKCLISKYGYLDDKEEFIAEKIKSDLAEKNREKHWEVLEKCLKVTGADICEKSYNSRKCHYEHKKEFHGTQILA